MRTALVLCAITIAVGLHAQQPPTAPTPSLAFEVASIKESKTLADGGGMRLMPDGGITARNIPARTLITIAYSIRFFQLVGLPEWAVENRYDVVAKPAQAGTRQEIFQRLQALLAERFKLAFHRESREMDGFALVQARPGVLGPNLKTSAVDCEKEFSSVPRCKEGLITQNTMKAVGTPMWSLLQLVIGEVNGPVNDETGLQGTFDFDLRWSNDVAPTDDLRSIYTALQEQLGLKLERRRVPVEVLVIDHVEQPTPD